MRLLLDICKPEGKTWLAEVSGVGGKYGLQRDFTQPVERSTSKSGATGTATYIVTAGIWESHEGRKRLGKRYWMVTDDEAVEITLEDVHAHFTHVAT